MRQPSLQGSSPEREVHTQHVVPKISSSWTANTPDPQVVVSMGSGETMIISRIETHPSAKLDLPSRAIETARRLPAIMITDHRAGRSMRLLPSPGRHYQDKLYHAYLGTHLVAKYVVTVLLGSLI